MMRQALLLLVLLSPCFMQGQDSTKCCDEPPVAQFPGGEEAFMSFLRKNIQDHPIAEDDEPIRSKEIVSFVVDEYGAVGDIKIIKSISPTWDKEMVRVLSMMPCFIPPTIDGKPVKSNMVLPFIFDFR